MRWIPVLIFLVSSGCGKAEFAAQSDPINPASVSMISIATDIYAELGEQFATQAAGPINLTLARLFATTSWAGKNPLNIEIRLATVGTAPPGSTNLTGTTKPASWDAATVIFNQTVAGSAVPTQLLSPNISGPVSGILVTGKFWILVRLNYAGLGLGDVLPLTLVLSNVYAYVEGNKSLKPLSPLLNLSF